MIGFILYKINLTTDRIWAGETSQLVEYLSCMHEDLSLDPQHLVKTGWSSMHLSPQHLGERDKQIFELNGWLAKASK